MPVGSTAFHGADGKIVGWQERHFYHPTLPGPWKFVACIQRTNGKLLRVHRNDISGRLRFD
jgi:hypothetical protein